MELYGIKGNLGYLLDGLTKTAYAFSTTDLHITRKVPYNLAYAEIVNNALKVECVSIAGFSLDNTCDLYYGGKHATVNCSYLEAYNCLPKKRVNNLIMPYKDKKLKQIIVVFSPGTITRGILEKLFKISLK